MVRAQIFQSMDVLDWMSQMLLEEYTHELKESCRQIDFVPKARIHMVNVVFSVVKCYFQYVFYSLRYILAPSLPILWKESSLQ